MESKQVRIDADVHERLMEYAKHHPYRATLQAVASYAISRWLDEEEAHDIIDVKQGD